MKIAVFCCFFVALVATNGYATENPAGVNFVAYSDRDLGCLALNIYHEGRGESTKGQAAIAAVTLNRVRSKKYPNTVCAVVWQKKQFSWTSVPAKFHTVNDFTAWDKALVVAKAALNGERSPAAGDATHYHANTVLPYWITNMKQVAKIGNHVFYVL